MKYTKYFIWTKCAFTKLEVWCYWVHFRGCEGVVNKSWYYAAIIKGNDFFSLENSLYLPIKFLPSWSCWISLSPLLLLCVKIFHLFAFLPFPSRKKWNYYFYISNGVGNPLSTLIIDHNWSIKCVSFVEISWQIDV